MLNLLAMPKPASNPNRVPVSVRMEQDMLDKLIAIGKRSGFRLTVTQLVYTAVREYIDRHDSDSNPQPPASRGKR